MADLVERPMMSRSMTLLLSGGCIIVITAGLRAAQSFVTPLLVAVVLTVAALPVAQWARNRGWPRWVGALLCIVVLWVVLGAMFAGLVLAAVQLATLLPQYSSQFTQFGGSLHDLFVSLGASPEVAAEASGSFDLTKVLGVLVDLLVSGLSLLSALVFLLAIMAVVTIEAVAAPSRNVVLSSRRPLVATALGEFARNTQRYFFVATLFGAIVAVIDGLVVWWLGIPLPFIWAIVAFATNFIPNVGFIIGVVPPAVLGLLEGGWSLMLVVVVVYSVVNVVVQVIIQPRFVSDSVGLSLLATFFSLIFWTFVLGPMGAVIAIPVTLLARALFVDSDPELSLLSSFTRPPAAEERVARPPRRRRGAGTPATGTSAAAPGGPEPTATAQHTE